MPPLMLEVTFQEREDGYCVKMEMKPYQYFTCIYVHAIFFLGLFPSFPMEKVLYSTAINVSCLKGKR